MIRVVWGAGTGPTALAAYDAALAAANVHDYNLVTVSSIVPPGVPVEPVGTAPDLGDVGDRLTVVEARGAAAGPATAVAGLGWSVGADGGVIYEAGGETDADAVERELHEGLAAARELRGMGDVGETVRIETAEAPAGRYAAAAVLAVFGGGEPIV